VQTRTNHSTPLASLRNPPHVRHKNESIFGSDTAGLICKGIYSGTLKVASWRLWRCEV